MGKYGREFIHPNPLTYHLHPPYSPQVHVAIGAESHNVEARRDPTSGLYLLFHIGAGARAGTTGTGIRCTNGSTSSCIQCSDQPPFHTQGHTFPWRCCSNLTLRFPVAQATPGVSVAHTATDPSGPWTPLPPSASLRNLRPSYCRDNPTAYIAPNGTAFVLAVCHLPNP